MLEDELTCSMIRKMMAYLHIFCHTSQSSLYIICLTWVLSRSSLQVGTFEKLSLCHGTAIGYHWIMMIAICWFPIKWRFSTKYLFQWRCPNSVISFAYYFLKFVYFSPLGPDQSGQDVI